MKLYLLMYFFFAESSSDPLIVWLNETGKMVNKYFPYVNIILVLGLIVFILGIFLFHWTLVIKFASLIIKPVSKKFSGHLEELSRALRRNQGYKDYQWLKIPENEAHSNRKIFESWMQNLFTAEYFNNVTACAYFGASILILIIGLRGIRIFISDGTPMLVIFGILLEFSMLVLLAFTQFYTPENPEKNKGGEEAPEEEMKNLRRRLRELEGRLLEVETSLNQATKLVLDAQDSIDKITR
jgi:hypothetical protein